MQSTGSFGFQNPWKLRRDNNGRPGGKGLGVPSPAHVMHGDWLLGIPGGTTLARDLPLPKVIAVGGGKGGVGKSFISANLAAKMGAAGQRVLLVDFDLGGANLHTYFGMGVPQRSLADFCQQENWGLRELVIPAPTPRVVLVAGGRNEMWSTEPSPAFMARLWRSLLESRRDLGADVVILDLGAGLHRHTVDFFMRAHLGIVTVLPEPTSIENSYAFLKACFLHLAKAVGENLGCENEAEQFSIALQAGLSDSEEGRDSHRSRLARYAGHHPKFGEAMLRAISGRWLGIVLNQSRSLKDVEIGRAMENICQTFFGFRAQCLGHLNYDEVAWKALRNQRLLVSDFPHSQISKKLSEVQGRVQELISLVKD